MRKEVSRGKLIDCPPGSQTAPPQHRTQVPAAQGSHPPRRRHPRPIYATATAALKSHFCSGRSRRMRRFEFRQRCQQPGETVAHFVSALRELAKLCDFGTLEDGLIVNQLIEKTSSNQLRERLLLESDSMTLADALVIGKQLESALAEAHRFARAADPPVTSSSPTYNQHCAPDAEFCITKGGANIMGLDLFLALG
uniref:Retrotransposon gag domain-containing protein n=1 Tax=Oryzias sinensis TaxID=183150 RepID=A0A8C7WWC8_9TELE